MTIQISPYESGRTYTIPQAENAAAGIPRHTVGYIMNQNIQYVRSAIYDTGTMLLNFGSYRIVPTFLPSFPLHNELLD